jgi:hypothetical protein
MLIWIIGVAVLVLAWGLIWKSNLSLALGILIGLPIAWAASKLLRPYITGMEHIPLWLPPLPFAIVATTLLVYGIRIWFRGAPPLPPQDKDEHSQH